MRVIIGILSIALGLSLVITAESDDRTRVLQSADERRAFKPLLAVPLATLSRSGVDEVTVTIPDDQMWQRIRRAWGDPGYVIAVVSATDRRMHCLGDFDLRIEARTEYGSLSLTGTPDALYGYSSDCYQKGLDFQARPGTTIAVRITGPQRTVDPSLELIVAAHWTAGIKDKLVGLVVEQDLLHLRRLLRIAGFVMFATGLFLVIVGPLRRMKSGWIMR